MTPQLQSYADAFRTAQTEAHRVADGLSPEQFNWKPEPKSWSVGECIVHLNTIAKGYLPALEEALQGNPRRAEGPFTYGWVSRRFISAVTPGSRPVPTGGAMKPPKAGPSHSDLDKARAMDSFDAYTERFVAVCGAASGVDLGSVKVRSPFLALLKLPAGAYLEALGLHAQRHVQQAERVTARQGFPA